jgi:hypothetical protein
VIWLKQPKSPSPSSGRSKCEPRIHFRRPADRTLKGLVLEQAGNDCHLAARQIGCQPRQSVEFTIRPAKFTAAIPVEVFSDRRSEDGSSVSDATPFAAKMERGEERRDGEGEAGEIFCGQRICVGGSL